MTPKFNLYVENLLRDVLIESVSFFVDSESTPNHVYEVASRILYSPELSKFFNGLIKRKKISQEEYKYFLDNKSFDFITLDGYATDEKKGNINLYTRAVPSQIIADLVSFIKYYIVEFNAELTGEPYQEKSKSRDSDVIRFPIKMKEEVENPPELNLANATARALIIDILNYPDETLETYESLNARELLMRIETIEDNDYILDKGVRPEDINGNKIDIGLSKERIKTLLDALKNLTEYAIQNHYTYINLS
jgi:hypothetical protein